MFFFLHLVYWLFLFSSRCNFFPVRSLQLLFHLINERHQRSVDVAFLKQNKISFVHFPHWNPFPDFHSVVALIQSFIFFFHFIPFRFALLCCTCHSSRSPLIYRLCVQTHGVGRKAKRNSVRKSKADKGKEREREGRPSRAKILECEIYFIYITKSDFFSLWQQSSKKTELFFLFIFAFPLSYPFRISQLENVKS